jgi:hypothetical protein
MHRAKEPERGSHPDCPVSGSGLIPLSTNLILKNLGLEGRTIMTKEQVGPVLSMLSNKYSVINLNPEDQTEVEHLVAELKSIFDGYSKKQ